MEDSKKRKLDEILSGKGENTFNGEEIRRLIEPLTQPQLVDLLIKLASQHPSNAEEIRRIASADLVHRRILVHGLAWHINSETLRAAFEDHGEIDEAEVIYDQETAQGYGFITYKNMKSAQNALRAPAKIIDTNFPICHLVCEKANSSAPTTPIFLRRVFIRGISPEVPIDVLFDYFGMHGEIEEGAFASDSDNVFGFVTYKTLEEAKMAVNYPVLLGENVVTKYSDYSCKNNIVAKTNNPQAVAPYPAPAYPIAPSAPYPAPAYPTASSAPYPTAIYPGKSSAPSPYPVEGQSPYPSVLAEIDQYGFPVKSGFPIQPVWMNSYPYNYPKQLMNVF